MKTDRRTGYDGYQKTLKLRLGVHVVDEGQQMALLDVMVRVMGMVAGKRMR